MAWGGTTTIRLPGHMKYRCGSVLSDPACPHVVVLCGPSYEYVCFCTLPSHQLVRFIGENFEPLWDQLFLAILEPLLFQPLGKQADFTSN